MKKILMLLLLALVLLPLMATPVKVMAFRTTDLTANPDAGLRVELQSLAARGVEVYHYNRSYVIAGIPAALSREFASSGTTLLNDPASAKLYLVSKLDGKPVTGIEKLGEVLLDTEDEIVLRSTLDDLSIRQAIRNPFTLLELVPMRLSTGGLGIPASTATRMDINQLISLVSTASIQSKIQALQDFQTRYALAPNHLEVAQWIMQQFQSFGVPDVQLFPFTWNNTTQYNVVATIPGSVYPDQYIVVGGHHDSTNNSGDPYTSAPGADDNASGTVSALEMARVMMQSGYQPRTSIRFITFAAEEFGLWGAKNYAAFALENDMNIRLMMNHDMVANNTASPEDWEVRLMPYDGSMNHSDYAMQITEQYTSLGAYLGTMNSGSSDSHPFWQRGYNVIYFFESEFCPYYHSSQDIVANMDPVYCTEVIKASTAVAATFADMPAAPANLVITDTGTGNSLRASWQGYNDPTIAHYKLYHGNSLQTLGDPILVNGTSFTISGLTEGETHYFGVSSIDTFGNESYMVYSAGIPYSIPITPTNFTDLPIPEGITFTWTANSELDLAGYRLYRSTDPAQTGTSIAQGMITTNSFTDTNVTGSTSYYYYRLCSIDTQGNSSPLSEYIASRPLTLNQGILIVDETLNMSGGNPIQPNDEQADSFYDSILQGFNISHLDLQEHAGNIRLADLGVYSSVVWHGNDVSDMDYPYTVRDALSQYLNAGGNIVFSVYLPTLAFDLNSNYPATFAETNYLNNVLGIGGTAYSPSSRFNAAIPIEPGFPLVEVDSLKASAALNYHITRVESISPSAQGTALYKYGTGYDPTTNSGSMYNLPIAVMHDGGAGKVFTFSFPLFNMKQPQAKALLRKILIEYFGETSTASDDPSATPPATLSIQGPWPNPFASTVRFSVLPKGTQSTTIGIYNLRGQLVREFPSVTDGRANALVWDGTDAAGKRAASGIYFIRATQSGNTVSRKMLLMRD